MQTTPLQQNWLGLWATGSRGQETLGYRYENVLSLFLLTNVFIHQAREQRRRDQAHIQRLERRVHRLQVASSFAISWSMTIGSHVPGQVRVEGQGQREAPGAAQEDPRPDDGAEEGRGRSPAGGVSRDLLHHAHAQRDGETHRDQGSPDLDSISGDGGA